MPKSHIVGSYLGQTAIFESETDRNRLAPYLELLIFTKGEEILKQGDEGNELYILVQGSLRIVASYEEFEDKVAVISGRGIIGEIAFTTEYCNRTASVYAETNCVLLKLTRERFDNFRVRFPDSANTFLVYLTGVMGEKLARTTQALVSVERYLNTIGQDYGVEDFNDIVKQIDICGSATATGVDTAEGTFIAPPE